MKYIGWAELVLGIWILASPWILGFSDITLALWSNLITGVVVVIVSLWGLFGEKQGPPIQ